MPDERPAQNPSTPKRFRETRKRAGGMRRRSKGDYENKAVRAADLENKGKAA